MLTLTTAQLLPGDIVLAHGMRCLVEDAPKLSRSHPEGCGGVYWTRTRVLNRNHVSTNAVPLSYTRQLDGSHRWTLQGNDLALHSVERVGRVDEPTDDDLCKCGHRAAEHGDDLEIPCSELD